MSPMMIRVYRKCPHSKDSHIAAAAALGDLNFCVSCANPVYLVQGAWHTASLMPLEEAVIEAHREAAGMD